MNKAEADDTAKLKQAEQAQQLSERRFSQFFATLPEYCYMISPDGKILDVNPAACEVLGYDKTELIGRPLSTIYAPESHARMSDLVEKWKRTGKLRNEEMVILTKQGEKRTVLLNAGSVVDPEGNLLHSTSVQVDITERIRADSALRESEERFRLGMNNVASGVYTLDLRGLVTYVNPAAETMFGWTIAELLGKKMHDVTHYKHPDGTPFPASECPGLQVLQKGAELHEYEDMFIRKDGSFFPVVYSASPLKKGAQTVGIVVGFRDDTQRREAEWALRVSEERFRLAAQAGRMFAYEWDAVTDQIVLSGVVSEILGEDAGTHVTLQHILTMIPAEDRERVIAVVAQLTPEKPSLQIRHRIVRSDGTLIWVERKGRAYFDEHGKMLRTVGMLADITDRVRTEEALRQKDRELSEAQRLAGVGSWHWDVRNDIVTWSEELYRIVGLDSKLPAPSYKEHPSLFPAESWERLSRAVEVALRDGTSYELDLEVIRPNDASRWVRTRGEAVGDATGRIVVLRGTAQDITEHKLAEEGLADMSRKLLEAQEQERARIGRELHDDINQRLALLSVEIQRMKDVAPATYGELRSRMDELGKRTSEISAVVQSLSHELHSSRLEYVGIVSAMKGFCKEFGDKHKVEVAFDNEGMPATVPQEVSLCLFRVMQEGLQNALKHSGVPLFEVKLNGSPTEIQLIVRDSGVGFEPELAKNTQGLGLISMQERVRLVKGTFLITSKPQSGTEINIRVPLSAGAQKEQTKLAGA